MKKYTKTNILFSIGIVLILILFFISFIPISNFVLKTTNNALKEGTFKKYESEFRMEFLKRVSFFIQKKIKKEKF